MNKSVQMRWILGLVFFAFLCQSVRTEIRSDILDDQDKVQWLKSNGVSILSSDPNEEDYSDLMPLVEKIGDSRVVLLGEQSHGDGTTFAMKCRLVRFLHKVMGFDVIAWESGLYDCREMEAALHSGVSLEEAVSKGIFGIWGNSRQVQSIFEFARNTYGSTLPLQMAGFDCQFSAASSAESFPEKLINFFKPPYISLLSKEEESRLQEAVNFKAYLKMAQREKDQSKDFVLGLPELIRKNRPFLERYYGDLEISYWTRIVKNLAHFYEMLDIMSTGNLKRVSDNNSRDQAMGDTLVWLANEYYAGHKIIVWAASFHIMRNGSEIDLGDSPMTYEGLKTMGDTVFEHLKDKAYSIAFTAYQGKAGSVNQKSPQDIENAPDGSLEYYFHRTGNQYMFLDFRQLREDPSHWLRQGVQARPLGYSYMITDWSKHFDAVIFTDTMEPSIRLESIGTLKFR